MEAAGGCRHGIPRGVFLTAENAEAAEFFRFFGDFCGREGFEGGWGLRPQRGRPEGVRLRGKPGGWRTPVLPLLRRDASATFPEGRRTGVRSMAVYSQATCLLNILEKPPSREAARESPGGESGAKSPEPRVRSQGRDGVGFRFLSGLVFGGWAGDGWGRERLGGCRLAGFGAGLGFISGRSGWCGGAASWRCGRGFPRWWWG